MNNKNKEFDNTDKKLHISDVIGTEINKKPTYTPCYVLVKNKIQI